MNQISGIKGLLLYVAILMVALMAHTCAIEADSHAEPRRVPARQA